MSLDFWKKFILMMFPKSEIFAGIIERFFTKYIYSLGSVPKAVHDWVSYIFLDLIPEYTTQALKWSKQFNFATAQSVEKLEAEFKQQGGQSPNYLQESLHNAGYTNLFVHEWWRAATDTTVYECGDGHECGDGSECGGFKSVGDTPELRNPFPLINGQSPNNLLVNPVQIITGNYKYECGDGHECGDGSECSPSTGLIYFDKIYPHPIDYEQAHYYFYIGGETWPGIAQIPLSSKKDVQRIIYKIKPMQQRVVSLVEYVPDNAGVHKDTEGDELVYKDTYGNFNVYKDEVTT